MLPVGPLLVVLATASSETMVAAFTRGDSDELVRLASRAGAAEIGPMLRSDDRGLIHAGLAAAPDAPDGWELLGELSRLAAGWDRSLAAPAARTAARIARDVDGDRAILLEMPDDMLASRQHAWAVIAARADRWTDVRVHALEVSAQLALARRATADGDPGLEDQLAVTLVDADPELRRAAAELVPQPVPEELRAALGARVRDDADPVVALAAAQALCADLAFDDDAASALAALGDDGQARLRTIVAGPIAALPVPALVDAARCLAAHGGRDDTAALRALGSHVPRAIRSWVQRIERSRKKRR